MDICVSKCMKNNNNGRENLQNRNEKLNFICLLIKYVRTHTLTQSRGAGLPTFILFFLILRVSEV